MKRSKIKILFVGPFPNPITGNSIANLAAYEGFKEKGYIVGLINSSLSFFDENVGVFSLKKLFYAIKFNFQAYKVARFDIVYITPGQTFFGVLKYALIIFIAKILKKKIIIHIHGNYLRKTLENLKGLEKYIVKKILGTADKGIVLSKSLIPNLLPVLDINDIYIVNNFVEDNLIKNTETIIENKSFEEVRIIFLSNLMKEKGIIDLLNALVMLKKEGISYKAKIAGNIDKQLKGEVEKLLKDLDEVEYLGVVIGQEKKQMLLWGNIFIFPTYYQMEGQPISILEAMAAGNIVLTTNHAGISDIFSEDNGLFIMKNNSEDIANKIKEILNKKEEYKDLIFRNYKYSTKQYTKSLYISNLEKVFN